MSQTLVQTQTLVQNQTLLSEIQECPICLEEIVGFKNRVTTECGHTFHCRCLLTNAAHNGFGCPFCRAELADEVQDSDSEEEGDRYDDDDDDEDDFSDDASRASDYDSEQDDLDGELEYIENQIVKMKEDHVLRGFRWLFQPINTDEEQVLEEAEEQVLEAEEVVNLDDDSDSEDTIWETESESSDYEM